MRRREGAGLAAPWRTQSPDARRQRAHAERINASAKHELRVNPEPHT